MSELQNPLFDEEKEFLERKKLEYERALRGDVEHIKDQSAKVGKVALVGAGLAGGIWLITKAFSGKKRKRSRADKKAAESKYRSSFQDEADYAFGSDYYPSDENQPTDGSDDGLAHKSAAESAQAFAEHHEQTHEADDLGFGSKGTQPVETPVGSPHTDGAAFTEENFEEDPFQDLPYDDSRRLPTSHAFDGNAFDEAPTPVAGKSNSTSRMIGSVLQAFLQSDTGKVLVGQVAAVALALVTKKVSEFFPPAKNSDLAASPGSATIVTGDSPVATSAPSVPSDASTQPQSL